MNELIEINFSDASPRNLKKDAASKNHPYLNA